ncbi:DUF1499 domain-containing protein [Maritimibacter sp. DP07]|uniref:DUF1499 domain-containing protein n=1 Tax=Maritimibacter harenae TaxID=2606218 RepID=A0A845M2J4_9RHOB|nr:DUF1499 domain-containing protein [Maritimibacter harenae]MZR13786.1 DUF1499 domain-containing protein [Maritimibacter harenae]
MSDFLARRIGLISVLLGIVSILLLAISVWGFRSGGWPWPRAYDLAGWGAWSAVAGVLVSAAGLFVWFRRRQGGAAVILLGLVLSLPVAGVGAVFEIAARTTPPINDVSTDTEDPPVFWFTATPSEYPARNAGPQRAAYPEVQPLEVDVPVDAAFVAALGLAEDRGWEVLSADPAESQIEAIARSRLFGFEDEVAVRITETATGARIDIRSRSRLGQIDRGANARRIEAYLADLATRIGN